MSEQHRRVKGADYSDAGPAHKLFAVQSRGGSKAKFGELARQYLSKEREWL